MREPTKPPAGSVKPPAPPAPPPFGRRPDLLMCQSEHWRTVIRRLAEMPGDGPRIAQEVDAARVLYGTGCPCSRCTPRGVIGVIKG